MVYTPIIVIGVFVVLFAVEKFVPLRRNSTVHLLARLVVNGVLSVMVFVIATFVVRPSTLSALSWAAVRPFGVMHWLRMPPWLQFMVGFLLLDLSFYYWHVLNHKLPWLWRFHNVHHIDPDLDVSTGFRFHFGEVLLSTAFRVIQVSLIGVSLMTLATYEIVFQVETLFHHSNLRLPIHLERLLNKIVVTPRMHGIHHSQIRRETNSNYSVVFSWWDRLHRTIGLNIPQSQIETGIAGYTLPEDNKLWSALAMPFTTQRDYWRKPDGTMPQRKGDRVEESPPGLAR